MLPDPQKGSSTSWPAWDAAESADYLAHHLKLAGREDPLFSDDAITLLHERARGIPRALNNLATQALIATFAAEKSIVDESAAQAAVAGAGGVADTTEGADGEPGLRPGFLVAYVLRLSVAGVFKVSVALQTAVDRLPRRQREVVDGEFYNGLSPEEIATLQGVERSTVYNSKAQALRNLNNDDCFFMALCGMRLVRDSERRAQIIERFSRPVP